MTAPATVQDSTAWVSASRLGVTATAALGVVLLAWAITVDYTRVSVGFFSDGATYYSLAHSLASDFDFEFRRDDLVRVWREFPSGPEGIFLKRGTDLDVGVNGALPFVHVTGHPDTDTSRLYYAKSFIFPLAAAPFVFFFGTNGFLVLHAVLMTLCFAAAYAFLLTRSAPHLALLFAIAFLLVSVAPVYMVWMTPNFFDLAMVLFAYFFWAYKEAASGMPAFNPQQRWLFGTRSDVLAAIFLGVATFSKPLHITLIAPMLALALLRRDWRRLLLMGGVYALVVGLLFGWNIAITGEWNYQGGDRRTFYSGAGGFPFQSPDRTFDAIGQGRSTNEVHIELLSSRDTVINVFGHNLIYFLFGRHTGFAVYYFPGVMAVILFLVARGSRPAWQWLTLAAGVGSAIVLLLYMPFTYSGGGGPVGNRYFLSVYPVFLFVMPPLYGPASSLLAMGVSALFTAQLIVNPFFASFRPGEHTKAGMFRLLPVELSLLNDLPMNVTPSKVRQPLGGTPPVLAYFLDDNAYPRESDAFWVRGESRADLMLRAPVVTDTSLGENGIRPLRIPRVQLTLETGPVPAVVRVRTSSDDRSVEIAASSQATVVVEMGAGLPYKPYPDNPTNYVYSLSIESSSGFIPLFQTGARDPRFLGVFVRLVPLYE